MERFDQKEHNAIQKVIASGELSRFFVDFKGGKNNQAFEKEFADYLGCQHAIAVNNGTVALEVALASLGLKPGDEVITTPLTFIATATAILRNRLKPVFVDIDPDTLNMDEFLLEDVITRKTKAIISVSLLGKPARTAVLYNIAKEHSLFLAEDAAQALGADAQDFTTVAFNETVKYQKIGHCGDISTFSFQESKTITTLGEGGMITTDNDKLAELCKHIRNHGNTYGTLTMEQPCTNARMTEAQAAFGRVQLTKIDEFIRIQRENAQILFDSLNYPFKPVYTEMDSTYYLIPYLLDKIFVGENRVTREKLIEKCKEEGISKGLPGENIGYYKKLVYDNPIFAKYKPKHGCRNAEIIRDNVLLFDIHRWNKTPEDMKVIAEKLNHILEKNI